MVHPTDLDRADKWFNRWGDWTAFLWDPDRFAQGHIDYNVIHSVKFGDSSCPFGANDLCTDPRVVNDKLETFDGHLQPESPALDTGLPVGALDGSRFMDQNKCWNYAFGEPEEGGEWRISCFACRTKCPYTNGYKLK